MSCFCDPSSMRITNIHQRPKLCHPSLQHHGSLSTSNSHSAAEGCARYARALFPSLVACSTPCLLIGIARPTWRCGVHGGEICHDVGPLFTPSHDPNPTCHASQPCFGICRTRFENHPTDVGKRAIPDVASPARLFKMIGGIPPVLRYQYHARSATILTALKTGMG
jgi:hypothetical protein